MQSALEQAIRLELVKWRLQQTLLLQLIIVVIADDVELLGLHCGQLCSRGARVGVARYLLVEEFEVGGALVLDILSLIALVVPVAFAFPLFILLILVIILREAKVFLALGLFTVYSSVSK